MLEFDIVYISWKGRITSQKIVNLVIQMFIVIVTLYSWKHKCIGFILIVICYTTVTIVAETNPV